MFLFHTVLDCPGLLQGGLLSYRSVHISQVVYAAYHSLRYGFRWHLHIVVPAICEVRGRSHTAVQGAFTQTATSSAGEVPELAFEPSSDQENTLTGNVSTGAAEAAAAATAAANDTKAGAKPLPAPASSIDGAWSSLCNEVLNASEVLNVSRLTRRAVSYTHLTLPTTPYV